MEFLESTKREETPIYPPVYWGMKDRYGLASILLVLIEKYPNIRSNLYPENHIHNRKKQAQCKELAKELFINIPEINIHLGNSIGLMHYTTSILMIIRRWTDTFLSVILTMPQSSNWPAREKIRILCPSFARLAPLLWNHLKTRKKFSNVHFSIAVARTHLEFCSAITVYDPQRAAAQIAAQDAVLRQLQDPYARGQDSSITHDISRSYKASRYRLSQPPQPKKATQQVTTDELGKKSKRFNKFQASEIKPLLGEREPQTNHVHQLGLKLEELKGETAKLKGIVIGLEGGKRKGCPSQHDRGGVADEEHLGKKQRRCESPEEPNPQELEKFRHRSSRPESPKASRYFNSDREDTQDNPNTSRDATSPRIDDNYVASADFVDAKNKEGFRPWHSPPHIIKPSTSSPPSNTLYVSSSKLFVPQVKEEAPPEQQGYDRALPPPVSSPHKVGHEAARIFPTATRTVVHTNDKAPSSTLSPLFFKKEEEDASEVSSWVKLEKAQLSTRRQDDPV